MWWCKQGEVFVAGLLVQVGGKFVFLCETVG